MAGQKYWTVSRDEGHGIQHVRIRAWKHFFSFMYKELLPFPTFIYRGQASSEWNLESTLDRTLRTLGKLRSSTIRVRHLENFKMATRGRRGRNPHEIKNDNEWWALGQHQGLLTPLLDWTTSPYVAAYFAYEELRAGEELQNRALFALDRRLVDEASLRIRRSAEKDVSPQVLEVIRPRSDENERLVSQGGLFTRCPDGVHVEEWVRQAFSRSYEYVVLIKITLPSSDRLDALRTLNRMNINRLSLFPDLSGSSTFSNFKLTVEGY